MLVRFCRLAAFLPCGRRLIISSGRPSAAQQPNQHRKHDERCCRGTERDPGDARAFYGLDCLPLAGLGEGEIRLRCMFHQPAFEIYLRVPGSVEKFRVQGDGDGSCASWCDGGGLLRGEGACREAARSLTER